MYKEIWKLHEKLNSEKEKLEVMIHSCDSACRAGTKHLLNLRESQAQSEELQEEMRMDMRDLEDHLAAANEQVEELTFCMSKMQETNESTLSKKELEFFVSKGELVTARAMRVREMELKDSLGKAHEEDLGLNA
jgi:aspartokinase